MFPLIVSVAFPFPLKTIDPEKEKESFPLFPEIATEPVPDSISKLDLLTETFVNSILILLVTFLVLELILIV
mgnify:CR=1 FL=1